MIPGHDGAVSQSVSSVGLLAVIVKLINGAGTTSELFVLAFIGLAVLKVGSNYLSQLLLVTFAQKDHLKIGHGSLLERVRAPYRTLERRGSHEILCNPDGRHECPGLGGERVAGLGDQCCDPGRLLALSGLVILAGVP